MASIMMLVLVSGKGDGVGAINDGHMFGGK
jgi:hypothetical protein